MKGPIEQMKKLDKKIFFIFILILLAQAIYLSITFGLCKKGYHSDELWNYGFSNSYNSKEMMVTDSGESLANRWLDSKLFTDYITVNPGQRFAYDRVYYNAYRDLNPPLQQILLHTICSLFPNVFSPWFAYVINIFSFIGAQIYLFSLVRLMVKNELIPIATVVLFGFGIGALDIVFFLRIYALGVFFAVMFAYYSHKIFQHRREKIKPINYISLLLSCFLGAFTLHEFLVYAFAITICYTLYYLVSRNFKVFFAHGFSCAGAVILSFLAYPKTKSNVGSIGDTLMYGRAAYPFGMQYRLYWYYLTKDLFGIHTDPFPNPYFERFIGISVFIIVLLIPVVILLRKESWFKKLIIFLKDDLKNTIKKLKNFQFSLIPQTVAVFFIIIIASYRTSIYAMGQYSNRYLFLCYPCAVIVLIVIIYYLLSFLIRKKHSIPIIISLIISFALCITSNLYGDGLYYFDFPKKGFTFEDFEEGSNSIMVLSAEWGALLFSPYLRNTASFYVTNCDNYEDDDILNGIELDSPLYLILDQSLLISDDLRELYYSDEGEKLREYYYDGNVILGYFESLDGIDSVDYVGHQVLFQRDYYIYRIKTSETN